MVEYRRESGVCEQSFGVRGSSEQDWNHSIEGRMLLGSAVSEAQSDNTVHGKQDPAFLKNSPMRRKLELEKQLKTYYTLVIKHGNGKYPTHFLLCVCIYICMYVCTFILVLSILYTLYFSEFPINGCQFG